MSSPKKSRGHQKKGTHGSLTKAGKSRDANKITNWRIDPETGLQIKSKSRKTKKGRPTRGDAPKRGRRRGIPRIKKRQKYKVATMCPACSGTVGGRVVRTPIKIGAHKCWKCNARLDWKGIRPKVREKRQII